MMNGYGEETGKNTAVRSKKFTNRSLGKYYALVNGQIVKVEHKIT